MAQLPLELLLKLKDETAGALNNAKSALGGLNMGAVALGGAALAGVGALAAGLWSAAQAAGQEELGVARLKAAVEASGGGWGTAQTAIENYLATEARRVALDDGEGRASLTGLTTATGDYNDAIALMPGVLDLARGAGISLEAATNLVTKAIDGSTAGLGKYGIEVEKGASATEILGAIQATMGGQAEAYGNTFVGSQEKMSIALGNIKETIGAAVLPALTDLITKFSEIATQALPYVEEAFGVLSGIIASVMPTISSVINTSLEIIIPALQWFFAFLQDPGAAMFVALQTVVQTVMSTIMQVITTIVAAITQFWAENGAQITATVTTTFNTIYTVVSTVITAVSGFITTALAALSVFWTEHGTQIMAIVSAAFNNVKTVIETIMGVVQGVIATVMALIHGDWSGAWEAIKGTLQTVWNGIKSIVTTTLDAIKPLLSAAWDSVKATATAKWEDVKVAIKGKWDGLTTDIGTAISTIKTNLETAWRNIKETAAAKWEEFKTVIRNANEGVWEKLFKEPWLRVQNFFVGIYNNLRDWISGLWNNIHIATPHFGITYTDVPIIGRIPSGVSVDWYAKGADFWATFPQLIGVGEAGPEHVQVTPEGGGVAGNLLQASTAAKLANLIYDAAIMVFDGARDNTKNLAAQLIYTLGGGTRSTVQALDPITPAIAELSDVMQIDLQPLIGSSEAALSVIQDVMQSDLRPLIGSSNTSLGVIQDVMQSDLRPLIGSSEAALGIMQGTIGNVDSTLTVIQGIAGGVEVGLGVMTGIIGGVEIGLTALQGAVGSTEAGLGILQGAVGGMETTLMNYESKASAAPIVINFEYAPVMSLADDQEAYDRIAPVLRQVLAQEARR